jgi:hypothetical protein
MVCLYNGLFTNVRHVNLLLSIRYDFDALSPYNREFVIFFASITEFWDILQEKNIEKARMISLTDPEYDT